MQLKSKECRQVDTERMQGTEAVDGRDTGQRNPARRYRQNCELLFWYPHGSGLAAILLDMENRTCLLIACWRNSLR